MEEFLPPDTLVRFQVDAFIEPDNIVFAGMYGVVTDHPHAHLICTPGVSTMITLIGGSAPYGYFNEWFTPVEEYPSEEDLQTSEWVYENAFEVYENEYGYSGFIKFKSKIYPQEKFFDELTQLTEKLSIWKNEEGKASQLKGNIKRISKILNSFGNHPLADRAEELSQSLKAINSQSNEFDVILKQIEKWVESASEIERAETQSDRILEARKQGNSVTFPYEEPE